jgi:hypothetical protein
MLSKFSTMKLLKLFFSFFVVVMISCAPIKSDKFYYTPHHAHYFKYPEGDSIQQYLSISGSKIFTDEKIDTIKFSYKWRAPISRLKYLKKVETTLYYTDSLGKKASVSYEVSNYIIYRDIPNRPYDIVRVPLVKRGDLCTMFDNLENKFTNDEFLNFEFENNYLVGYFPEGLEAEIKLTWEDDKEQSFKTVVHKSRSVTDKVRSRPFG